jgi:hypothetical protein
MPAANRPLVATAGIGGKPLTCINASGQLPGGGGHGGCRGPTRTQVPENSQFPGEAIRRRQSLLNWLRAYGLEILVWAVWLGG